MMPSTAFSEQSQRKLYRQVVLGISQGM